MGIVNCADTTQTSRRDIFKISAAVCLGAVGVAAIQSEASANQIPKLPNPDVGLELWLKYSLPEAHIVDLRGKVFVKVSIEHIDGDGEINLRYVDESEVEHYDTNAIKKGKSCTVTAKSVKLNMATVNAQGKVRVTVEKKQDVRLFAVVNVGGTILSKSGHDSQQTGQIPFEPSHFVIVNEPMTIQ